MSTRTIKDNWGDKVHVEAYYGPSTLRAEGHVQLNAEDASYYEFSPKQARRLAKALRKAAKIAKENA